MKGYGTQPVARQDRVKTGTLGSRRTIARSFGSRRRPGFPSRRH